MNALSTLTQLRLVLVWIAILTLPGWAALSFGRAWRRWKGLQSWIVAVGISLAAYPVLFYGLRLVPFLTLGPYKMGALLLACGLVAGWRLRPHWRELFTFGRLEWVALGILGMTLFSRFWVVRDLPYPAWTDSLHHTLLTRLTAQTGRLPFDLQPYSPVPLDQYHLGLYSLSATTQWLGQVPAHTALLWTAQVLNGLCGLGVYLALDRKVGRVGALVGVAVAGLLCHQPAWYMNWGRFTQLSGQIVLLIAWLVTWETLARLRQAPAVEASQLDPALAWSLVLASLLTGSVFLYHFRVAAFYLPLLGLSLVWELWRARKRGRVAAVVKGVIVLSLVSLLVISPALWESLQVYVKNRLDPPEPPPNLLSEQEIEQADTRFFDFSWGSLPTLTARRWLLVLAGLSAALGLIKWNKLVLLCLLWIASLYLIGQAYLLGISLLNVTNLGAVLILGYLPIGLVVGAAVQALLRSLRPAWRESGVRLVVGLTLTAGFAASHVRAAEVEAYRHFVTPQDVSAMDWIRQNVPPEARFAVNTHFWLPSAPHGTDAGYWLPYLTGNPTTLGTMLNSLGPVDFQVDIIKMSQVVDRLETDNAALAELQAWGVEYVYVGRKGDYGGPGLDANRLSQAPNASLLYQQGGVTVLKIGPVGPD